MSAESGELTARERVLYVEVNLGARYTQETSYIWEGFKSTKMAVCLIYLVTIAFAILFIPCWN